MSASAVLGMNSKFTDSGTVGTDVGKVSVAFDDALAALAVGRLDSSSAFGHGVSSAKVITDQHVAAGNLPNLDITRG